MTTYYRADRILPASGKRTGIFRPIRPLLFLEFNERTYSENNYRGNNCGEFISSSTKIYGVVGNIMYLGDPELEITYEITELSETSLILALEPFCYDGSAFYGYDIYTRMK